MVVELLDRALIYVKNSLLTLNHVSAIHKIVRHDANEPLVFTLLSAFPHTDGSSDQQESGGAEEVGAEKILSSFPICVLATSLKK